MTDKREKEIHPELPSLIFLGTPDFAVPALKRLISAGANIPLVITQPDRPSGRGKKPTASPVKVLAEQTGIPVYQPERIRHEDALKHIQAYEAECAVVVAYGQILPQAFLDSYPLGAINVHASLLPQYRGAAPIQRSILAGDTVTGVSLMLLDAGMDTGPVFLTHEIQILPEDSFGTLHDRLAQVGANLLPQMLAEWKRKRLYPCPQDDRLATYAPPIRKEEWRLSWAVPSGCIVNTIRAFDPWPGAFALHGGKRLKCFEASLLPWQGTGEPGEVVGHTDQGLVVLGGDRQALAIGTLQREGQRRLPALEFLRGYPIPPGSRLE